MKFNLPANKKRPENAIKLGSQCFAILCKQGALKALESKVPVMLELSELKAELLEEDVVLSELLEEDSLEEDVLEEDPLEVLDEDLAWRIIARAI